MYTRQTRSALEGIIKLVDGLGRRRCRFVNRRTVPIDRGFPDTCSMATLLQVMVHVGFWMPMTSSVGVRLGITSAGQTLPMTYLFAALHEADAILFRLSPGA